MCPSRRVTLVAIGLTLACAVIGLAPAFAAKQAAPFPVQKNLPLPAICPPGKMTGANNQCVPLKCATGQAANAGKNGCVAIPKITSVSPPGGNAGDKVTITGTGFAPGAAVTFTPGALAATNVQVMSGTQITATVPNTVYGNIGLGYVPSQVTVSSAGQTSNAVNFLECRNAETKYDAAKNSCAPLPPSCGANCSLCASPLVWNAAKNECVAPPPPDTIASYPRGSYTQSCKDMHWMNPTPSGTIPLQYGNPPQFVTAQCRFNNNYYLTALNVQACAPGADIENYQGHLQCQAPPGQGLAETMGQGGAVPKGSYQQSCTAWLVQPYYWPFDTNAETSTPTERQFISANPIWGNAGYLVGGGGGNLLTATCNNFNGGTTNAQLNLSWCDPTKDIENIKGTLTCTPLPKP